MRRPAWPLFPVARQPHCPPREDHRGAYRERGRVVETERQRKSGRDRDRERERQTLQIYEYAQTYYSHTNTQPHTLLSNLLHPHLPYCPLFLLPPLPSSYPGSADCTGESKAQKLPRRLLLLQGVKRRDTNPPCTHSVYCIAHCGTRFLNDMCVYTYLSCVRQRLTYFTNTALRMLVSYLLLTSTPSRLTHLSAPAAGVSVSLPPTTRGARIRRSCTGC